MSFHPSGNFLKSIFQFTNSFLSCFLPWSWFAIHSFSWKQKFLIVDFWQMQCLNGLPLLNIYSKHTPSFLSHILFVCFQDVWWVSTVVSYWVYISASWFWMVYFYYHLHQCGRDFLANEKYEGGAAHYGKRIQVMVTLFSSDLALLDNNIFGNLLST